MQIKWTNPSPSSTTTTSNLNRSTPHHPTSPGRCWPSLGLELDITHPPMTPTTLSPLFSETRYPSLPREGTKSHRSHSDSGRASPTSPIEGEDDNEAPTPLALGSRNPFLASIIVHQQTPSMRKGPTTSGTPSHRSTKRSSVQSELRHGSFDEQTSRPGRTGNTEGLGRTWTTSSPPAGEHSSTSAPLRTENSWPGVHANHNRELYCSHPGSRRPDLQAQTEEEHRILQGRLTSLTRRLDERLHREDQL